jgi:hypothetical protein
VPIEAIVQAPLAYCFVLFWATLMRALFVKARILPGTCGRCGLPFERRGLGEQVCRCRAESP